MSIFTHYLLSAAASFPQCIVDSADRSCWDICFRMCHVSSSKTQQYIQRYILFFCCTPLNATVDYSSPSRKPLDFDYFYHKWEPICAAPYYNQVLPRRDGINEDKSSKYREWSLSDPDMHTIASTKYAVDSKRWCDTMTQITKSVSQPIGQQSCFLQWYDEVSLCEIAQRFSVIVWSGDSLTRHMTMGLMMLWTGDYRFGGFARKPDTQNKLYNHCSCDGQFSEALICRDLRPGFFQFSDARTFGLCGTVERYNSPRFYMHTSNYKELHQMERWRLCSTDHRFRFISLQAGTHYDTNATYTIQNYLQPALAKISRLINSCTVNRSLGKKMRVIYIGVPVVSARIEKLYPQQHRNNVQIHNVHVRQWLDDNYPYVLYVDIYNLTKNGTDHTSDGFHSLSDVNMIKASYILNIMDAMSLHDTRYTWSNQGISLMKTRQTLSDEK